MPRKITPLNVKPETIRAAVAAQNSERAKKAAATRAANKAAKQAAKTPAPVVDEAALEAKQHAQNLEAVKAEAAATGMTLEEAAESMGVDLETGAPKAAEGKRKYDGPMLALVAARKAYVKAKNGILCNGDALAQVCGEHSREETVAALKLALKLESNPYAHLNPGQQSMNLRNKARHALKDGTLTMAEIRVAFKQVKPEAVKAA